MEKQGVIQYLLKKNKLVCKNQLLELIDLDRLHEDDEDFIKLNTKSKLAIDTKTLQPKEIEEGKSVLQRTIVGDPSTYKKLESDIKKRKAEQKVMLKNVGKRGTVRTNITNRKSVYNSSMRGSIAQYRAMSEV